MVAAMISSGLFALSKTYSSSRESPSSFSSRSDDILKEAGVGLLFLLGRSIRERDRSSSLDFFEFELALLRFFFIILVSISESATCIWAA